MLYHGRSSGWNAEKFAGRCFDEWSAGMKSIEEENGSGTFAYGIWWSIRLAATAEVRGGFFLDFGTGRRKSFGSSRLPHNYLLHQWSSAEKYTKSTEEHDFPQVMSILGLLIQCFCFNRHLLLNVSVW